MSNAALIKEITELLEMAAVSAELGRARDVVGHLRLVLVLIRQLEQPTKS